MTKTISSNRRAYHNYEIIEKCEAGLELLGTEVKALRAGRASLNDGFARFDKGELFLYNVHISPYEHGNRENHDPLRQRKVLLHKRQLMQWHQRAAQKGVTIVPLKLYFKGPFAKVELGLAQGKRQYDKRQTLKEQQDKREIDRMMKR